MPRQIQLSEKTLKKIAEALFLAYTVEQAAFLGGISKTTLGRIKGTALWTEIEEKALELEKPYRRKVWSGQLGWQGAAWMLERKYPQQLARPEIQLQVNASSTTNNTLIITAEQASNLKSRSSAIEAELVKLKPRSTATEADPNASSPFKPEGGKVKEAKTTASGPESQAASAASSSACAAGSEPEGHHSPPRTSGQRPEPPDPNLAGNCQPSGSSGNSKRSGRHMTVADGRKRRDDVGRRASRRDEAKIGGAAASAGVRKRGKYGVRMKKKAGG